MMELLAALATGAACVLFVLYLSRRGKRFRPADNRLRKLNDEPTAKPGMSWDEVRRRGPSNLPVLRDWLLESSWARGVMIELEQSGLKLRIGEYIIIRVLCGILPFVLIWALGRSLPTFIFGLVVGVVGFMVPSFVLRSLRRSRIKRIDEQLPEAVTMMASGLRAGFAFQHGLAMVAEQMESPISDEFTRTIVDMNVGATIEEALHGLLDRCDSDEMNLIVTAVLVQRTSGGNLAEILESVGEHMRERERLTGEVKTQTAQQRFSGLVLTLWPLFVLAAFALFNWDQTSLLFTTTAGLVLLGIAFGLQLLGFLSIRRILDIEL